MKLFSVFFIYILLYENSITIRYSVTTIRVFEYYSEIENGPNTKYISFLKFYEYRIIRFLELDRIPNMNSTIRSQLFEYRIIRIIRCNSVAYLLLKTVNIKTFREGEE